MKRGLPAHIRLDETMIGCFIKFFQFLENFGNLFLLCAQPRNTMMLLLFDVVVV